MTSHDLGPFHTIVTLPHTFPATRIINTHITPCEFNLEVVVAPKPHTEKSVESAALGFGKIKAWMEIALNDTILINNDSDIVHLLEEEVDNVLFKSPGEPDDVLVASLILSKIRAIVGNNLLIVNVTLWSSDTGNIKRMVAGDLDGLLPGIEYLGVEAAYKKPWWERETIETVDFTKEDSKDEYFAELVAGDPLKEIEKAFLTNEADIITMDTWKPEK